MCCPPRWRAAKLRPIIGWRCRITELSLSRQRHGSAVTSHARRRDAPRPGSFRKDIEGLRAVAVVLVVLDHLVSWPRAGFVGVDVFFVISGFLITGLLLNESERRGRISIRNFYARRARRILPAALTVLLVVAVAAHLVFRGARVKDTVTDVWWSVGFSANVHFANIGRRLSSAAGRSVLLAVVGAGTVASYVWALQQTAQFPAAAYFSTPVRAWELGAGALVAVASARFPGIPHSLGRARGPLSALGVAGIVVSSFIVNANSGFPAPGATLPVVGAALVIVAGIGAPLQNWTAPLTNLISTYIGRVSFSLYLWHWPVIIIVGALIPKSATVYYPVILTAVAALTVFSYHVIESPLRTADFTIIVHPRRSEWRRPNGSRRILSPVHPYAALASGALAVAVLILYMLQPPPPVPASTDGGAESPPIAASQAGASVAQPSAPLSQAIALAADATSWPTLVPSLDHLDIDSAFAQWKGCRGARQASLTGCTFGDPANKAKVAVVLGDSFAMAWMPTIRAALVPQHWVVYGLLMEQCPAAFVSVLDGQRRPTFQTDCESHHAWMISETARLNPRLVILASNFDFGRLASKASGGAAEAEYQAGMEKTISAVKAAGKPRVLTLSPPPGSPPLESCVTAVAQPSSCLGKLSGDWWRLRAIDAAASTATATDYADTRLWFCTTRGVCPSFVGSTPVRWDGAHLTSAYASSLGPEMAGFIANVMK